MKLAAFTTWFNDLVILDVWLKYYSQHFDKLFVMNDKTKEIYLPEMEKRTKQYGVEFRRGESLENVQCANNEAKRLQTELLKDFDWVLFANCDEIITPDPNKDFRELIKNKNTDYISCEGYEVIEWNEPAIDFTKPLLKQRKYWMRNINMNKTIFSRVPLEWREGQHSLHGQEAEDSKAIENTGLYLIHLRHFNLQDDGDNPRDFGPFFHPPHGYVLEKMRDHKTLMPDWVRGLI